MGQVEQIDSLKEQHAELEQALESEKCRPLPDLIAISDIKKHKLRIKDEIARLSH